MSNEPVMSISGKVHYLPRIGLEPNSTLYVSLEDVSLADVPAKQLAAQITSNAETAGLGFNLVYCIADVLPGHTYAIKAQIKVCDRLVFTSTEHPPIELGVSYLQPLEVLVDLA
ncbi:YbaY family lipoprotein [Pseudomonas sp. PD9R]|uniref:YbaY family lipoprotein n=1 Tax=Pseudomonas sp. PD9R TaxID=2853534 RepID=UPI001C4546BF|nr:YbaY family lipoprotein [Pseudomonas sp. PD9R]MBV6822445.1 YbaY family lipoprotein [Pseudomonas sp. PD9R]